MWQSWLLLDAGLTIVLSTLAGVRWQTENKQALWLQGTKSYWKICFQPASLLFRKRVFIAGHGDDCQELVFQ